MKKESIGEEQGTVLCEPLSGILPFYQKQSHQANKPNTCSFSFHMVQEDRQKYMVAGRIPIAFTFFENLWNKKKNQNLFQL